MQILKRIGLFVLGALVVAAALLAVRSIAFPARTAAAWQPGESMAALSAVADDLAPDAATQKALLQALPATCAEAATPCILR